MYVRAYEPVVSRGDSVRWNRQLSTTCAAFGLPYIYQPDTTSAVSALPIGCRTPKRAEAKYLKFELIVLTFDHS
jgi:hypothetical protein